jgi:hypothetical protein
MARAESVVALTEGSGKNFHTISNSYGGTTKEDQVVVLGLAANPKYSGIANAVATTTSAAHLFAIEADGANYVEIKSVVITQVAGATTQTLAQFQGFRTTTASTTGTALAPKAFNSTGTYGGRCVSIPGAKGTEGNQLTQGRLQLQTTAQVAATTVNPNEWRWDARLEDEPILFGPATTDGFVIKIVTGIATSTVDIVVEFITHAFAP